LGFGYTPHGNNFNFREIKTSNISGIHADAHKKTCATAPTWLKPQYH